jgi:metal-responsive CopG/Arc/MetJ family transcriptional regulator
MASRNISISLPEAQLKTAEQLARAENRSMSELFLEALRSYEKQRRAEMAAKYRPKAEAAGITEADVVRIIKEWRQSAKR